MTAMTTNDRALGMDRMISRREFVNGVSAAAAGALLLPKWALTMEEGQDYAPEQGSGYYPPALTGMRGDHAGSFEVAHALRDRRSVDVSSATHTGESYDLVVVGAGMSGLAAAYYFLKNVGRGARVLILDNHDDFGGHAKRNEFRHEGTLLAIKGLEIVSLPRRVGKSGDHLQLQVRDSTGSMKCIAFNYGSMFDQL